MLYHMLVEGKFGFSDYRPFEKKNMKSFWHCGVAQAKKGINKGLRKAGIKILGMGVILENVFLHFCTSTAEVCEWVWG